MSKTFTFAGTCTENGATVYKFANDANRAKALERFGCTDVNMIALPNAMDKDAAVAYLAQVGMTATKAPRAAKTAKPAKAKVEKAAKSTPVAKVAKRVGDKPRKGQTPEAFALEWFASKEAKVAEKRAKGLLP
jgi:hypothetical protein